MFLLILRSIKFYNVDRQIRVNKLNKELKFTFFIIIGTKKYCRDGTSQSVRLNNKRSFIKLFDGVEFVFCRKYELQDSFIFLFHFVTIYVC